MTCLYWSDIGSPSGGACAIHRVKPSFGFCRQCTDNTESGVWPIAVAKTTPIHPLIVLTATATATKNNQVMREELEKRKREEWVVKGPLLWRELHARPDAYAEDEEAERKWWEGFLRRVPCGQCRQHAIQYERDHPMATESAEGLRKWGRKFHDAVNARLNKPLWIPPL